MSRCHVKCVRSSCEPNEWREYAWRAKGPCTKQQLVSNLQDVRRFQEEAVLDLNLPNELSPFGESGVGTFKRVEKDGEYCLKEERSTNGAKAAKSKDKGLPELIVKTIEASTSSKASSNKQTEQNTHQQQQALGTKPSNQLQQTKRDQKYKHRIVSPPAFHACGESGRCVAVTEHFISVPVYRSQPQPPLMDLHFTIVERVTDDNREWLESLQTLSPPERAKECVTKSALSNADNMALFLQGGPGFGSPTPIASSLGLPKESSWAATAMDQGHSRIVLMDQRGTGRSTPITKQTLEIQFPDLFLLDDQVDLTQPVSLADFPDSDEKVTRVEQAVEETTEYLVQFRADSIVLDAEAIKEALLIPMDDDQVIACTVRTK